MIAPGFVPIPTRAAPVLGHVTAIGILLSFSVGWASAAEQRPPFLTREDQRRCIVQDSGCVKWIYQKALVGRIVQQVLTARGFEAKTAFFIARDWDAFRYDIETGVKILPKPAMLVTTDDALDFAGRIPQCFADMATSACQIRFAPEYGCNLQRDYAPACRRAFNGVKAKFPRMQADGKTFMSWFDAEYNFYNGIACIFGPNGGDIPVFDAGLGATVTKLKFDAGTEGTRFAGLARPASAASPAGPTVTPAPVCKAVIRSSHWRANDVFRDGQELPEQLEVAGLDVANIMPELRRKGDPPPAQDQGVSSDAPGAPRIIYTDLPDGWLGMELGKIQDVRAPNATLPRAPVIYVAPNSPAAQAGIQKGDYILRLGGRAVDDAMYLGLHTTEAPIGKPMNVVYQRDGKSTTVGLTAIDIEEAGRQNDVSALRYLGDFYADRRYAIAPASRGWTTYYSKAAELGDVRAMARLANRYNVSEKEADRAEARKWYEKAASAGHVPSSRRLANMYAQGEGGPKNPVGALQWLEKGAAAGDIEQMYEIVLLHRNDSTNKAHDQQRKWLEKIVAVPKNAVPKDGGRVVDLATYELAIANLNGIGGPKDLAVGRALLEKAAASGSVSQAPYAMGMLLVNKEGGPDFAKAKFWFERGTKGENADPNAMWALGFLYKEGAGVPKNLAEARKWFKKAAELGHQDAIKEVGIQRGNSKPNSRIEPP